VHFRASLHFFIFDIVFRLTDYCYPFMSESSENIKHIHNLDVEIISEADDEVREHLKKMILGTPGKLQYRSLYIEEKFPHIGYCRFLLLKKSGYLLGTVCLANRKTSFKKEEHSSWYIRYFHIRAPLRSSTQKTFKRKAQPDQRSNIFLEAVDMYFRQPEMLLNEPDRSTKSLIYAVIERENYRSANFAEQLGIKACRSFKTFFFSRFRPKYDGHVNKLVQDSKSCMADLISEFYNDHILFTSQNLFYNNNYFVYTIEDEIVAGVQSNPEAWEIQYKPGLSGWFIRNVLTRIPFISNVLNLKNFRFSALEGIYFKEGFDHLLIPLIESVCSSQKTHFAISWLDSDSHVLKSLQKTGKKGFLARLISVDEADIRIKFINWNSNEIEEFTSKPAYLSCFDMM